MVQVVGIRFKQACRIYDFAPSGLDLKTGDVVVVDTIRGQEIGAVARPPKEVAEETLAEPLKPVIRIALPEDFEMMKKSREKEAEALTKCKEIVRELNLAMKPIAAQSNLQGNYVTVFFSAETRVDFRELVRRLSRVVRARVELKQVGTRDEAKLVGGIGRCGRPLCCQQFLVEFTPLSIRMAKDQDLSPNPMKISGACGRLLCCLGYEIEQYRDSKSRLPKVGQTVKTPLGDARVLAVNTLKEAVTVELESKAAVEYPASELQWQKPEKKEPQPPKQQKQQHDNRQPTRSQPPARTPQGANPVAPATQVEQQVAPSVSPEEPPQTDGPA
jgi:cell fate regulator YaaT (PSP1 superfamily)